MSLTRNQKGLIGFFILSLFLGIVIYPFMIGREYYQWKYQNTTGWDFEWDDIRRYTIVILLGCLIHYGILYLTLI